MPIPAVVPVSRDDALAPRVLYWRETTDTQPFETGIQRVTRRLAEGLARRGVACTSIGWDPVRRLPRAPSAKAAGLDGEATWLILPEIPLSVLIDDLDPVRIAHAYGLRAAAIVHDLIPARFAELYTAHEQAMFRRYFRMFAETELVFATTQLVAGHLRAHLAREGLRVPPIAVVPLPAQFGNLPRVRDASAPRRVAEPLRLLNISTWEPRKNLPRLLRAVRSAQARSAATIQLTLVGRRAGHAGHDAEVDALVAALPGTAVHERLGDAALAGLAAGHHAAVYPSCEEGFGMPVLESLWLGRPCLCHDASAMAEVAPGGGTWLIDMGSEDAIADALVQLADEPGLLTRLEREALARPLRDWDNYAAAVASRLGLAAGVDP